MMYIVVFLLESVLLFTFANSISFPYVNRSELFVAPQQQLTIQVFDTIGASGYNNQTKKTEVTEVTEVTEETGETKDELLIYQCQGDSFESTFVEKLLHQFVYSLKLYLNETHFDQVPFEMSIKSLSDMLSYSENFTRLLGPCQQGVYRQLNIARYMFSTMLNSARALKYLDVKENDQKLVQDVATLSVRILSLYNAEGYPDRSNPHLERSLFIFSHLLQTWRDTFWALDNQSFAVIPRFEYHYAQAAYSLKVLEDGLSQY